MVKITELRNADDVRADHMRDADYRREHERTKLANDVAIKVIQYRVANRLSQAELGRRLGMRQPNVARLESGDHEPSLDTLRRLATVLNLDFSVDVKPDRVRLRHPVPASQGRRTGSALTKALRAAAKPARESGTRIAVTATAGKVPKRSPRRSAPAATMKSDSARSSGGKKPPSAR